MLYNNVSIVVNVKSVISIVLGFTAESQILQFLSQTFIAINKPATAPHQELNCAAFGQSEAAVVSAHLISFVFSFSPSILLSLTVSFLIIINHYLVPQEMY